MNLLLDVLSWITIVTGGIFMLIGGFGLLRFPDLFTRLHAASVMETFGAGLLLIGLMLQAGPGIALIKLVLIVLFLILTSPTSAHALARAAMHGGVRPEPGDKSSN